MRLSRERDELKVVNDQFGSPTFAEDFAKTIIHITNLYHHSAEKFIPGMYHYSNEGQCSWYDFAREIVTATESKCKLIPVTSSEFPSAAKRPSFSLLDKTKIKSIHCHRHEKQISATVRGKTHIPMTQRKGKKRVNT